MPDFVHTEIVSKYGIMFSMDVFPHHPSSDQRKLSPDDFTSITLNRWKDEGEMLRNLAVLGNKNASFNKMEVNAAHDLLEHSKLHGTTSIHHSMYINAINTKPGKHPRVYVISSALPAFIKGVMPKINRPFVLVSGDSVLKTPSQLFNNDEEMHRF